MGSGSGTACEEVEAVEGSLADAVLALGEALERQAACLRRIKELDTFHYPNGTVLIGDFGKIADEGLRE
jgi:hypothetical protein